MPSKSVMSMLGAYMGAMGATAPDLLDMMNDKSLFGGFGNLKKYRGHSVSVRTYKKIGRNEPCPCESGKKFKKCCIDTWHLSQPEPSPIIALANENLKRYAKDSEEGKAFMATLVSTIREVKFQKDSALLNGEKKGAS